MNLTSQALSKFLSGIGGNVASFGEGMISEFQGSRPEIGRVGMNNPPAYQPQNLAQKAGSGLYKLAEDVAVGNMSGINQVAERGLSSLSKLPAVQNKVMVLKDILKRVKAPEAPVTQSVVRQARNTATPNITAEEINVGLTPVPKVTKQVKIPTDDVQALARGYDYVVKAPLYERQTSHGEAIMKEFDNTANYFLEKLGYAKKDIKFMSEDQKWRALLPEVQRNINLKVNR